jgi:hypothetical protein
VIVALIGLVVSLFAYLLAFPRPEQRRFDIYAALLVLHIVTTIGYWLLSFESGMDAFLYYRDPLGFIRENPFETGTYFVVHFVQAVKNTLGGSFLDHFLFFQGFGMVGMALLIRSFNEIADSFGMRVPLHVYLILFLPGLHFWTGGIGKDSPMIMAVCLAAWAAIRLERRFVWMGLALFIMAVIRPHVGVVTVLGVVGALALTKQLSLKIKLALAPLAVVGLLYVGLQALERFRLGLDFESISNFVEIHQGFGEEFGGGADLQNLPFPMKVFTLLFRPLYIDAPGVMGLVASVENTLLLYLFGYVVWHWRLLGRLLTRVSYITYNVAFAVPLVLMLAMVNYNVGLGQRQKMMAVPALLLIYGTIYLYKRYLTTAAAQAQAQAYALAESEAQAAPGAAYGQPSQA